MKKYMIGGDPTANTSDELNPYKIKTPVAPNPSFVPSGSMAQDGKETQKKSENSDTTSNAYALQAKEYANELKRLKEARDAKIVEARAKAMAALKNAKDKGEIPPMKKGGQMKKSKKC
jgi:hypothetical protein